MKTQTKIPLHLSAISPDHVEQQASRDFFSNESMLQLPVDLMIQKKLQIGAVDDPLEKEADAMANRVMRMPETNFVQRKCSHCEEEEKIRQKLQPAFIQKKSAAEGETAVPSYVNEQISSTRGSGNKMDGSTASFMESRFSSDFSAVRIHADEGAVQMSRALNAKAFTVGSDIYFNEGEYKPSSSEGKHLLAHELTHTIQQGASGIVRRQPPQSPGHSPITTVYEDEDPLTPEQRAELVRNRQALINRVMEPLARHDSITFLRILRNLTSSDTLTLLNDDTFISRLSHAIGGAALWSAYRIIMSRCEYLDIALRNSELIRRFSLAISFGNGAEVMRLYSVLLPLFTHEPFFRFAVLEQVVDQAFRGNPMHDRVLAFIRARPSGPVDTRNIRDSYDEIHYEMNETTNQYELMYMSGSANYTLYVAGGELRVVVVIRLVDAEHTDQTYYVSDARENTWKEGIERRWNNLFTITNGTQSLRITFYPVFSETNPNQTVRVVRSGHRGSCPSDSRAYQTCWMENGEGDTAAHEFGHMIGNQDEYRMPHSASDVPATSFPSLTGDRRTAALQGSTGDTVPNTEAHSIPGTSGGTWYTSADRIMVGGEGPAQSRHVRGIIRNFNSTLNNGLPEYRLVP